MFANRYSVFVDACSLAGALKRDILLTLAEAEFFRLQWSEQVLKETEQALAEMFRVRGRTDPAEEAKRQRQRMDRAFPEAMIGDYESFLVVAKDLPDKDDAHVLAAALRGQASTIVTENTRDFPLSIVSPLGLEVKTADEFIANTIELDIGKAVAAIRRMRERYRNPALTGEELLLRMEAAGLAETADLLRPHASSL